MGTTALISHSLSLMVRVLGSVAVRELFRCANVVYSHKLY